jgi:hypothetical protein
MIVSQLVKHADFFDFMVSSVSTKGFREHASCVLQLQPGKEDLAIPKALLDRKPFSRFDRFIPADATAFALHPGFDLEGLYGFVTDFVKTAVPGGGDVIAGIEAKMAAFGLDLQRDVFSWWSGEIVSVEMPAAVVTPIGSWRCGSKTAR